MSSDEQIHRNRRDSTVNGAISGDRIRHYIATYCAGGAMIPELESILLKVKKRIERKAQLYDGHNTVVTSKDNDFAIKCFMFSVIEEAGEVSSALTRERVELARDECIDIVHSAILLYLAIDKKLKEEIL